LLHCVRWGHSTIVFADGEVAIFGGYGGTKHVRCGDLYTCSAADLAGSAVWRIVSPAGTAPEPRLHHTATVLSAGVGSIYFSCLLAFWFFNFALRKADDCLWGPWVTRKAHG
jgi:hypothetical protein